MRVLAIVALGWLVGCGDDSTTVSHPGRDLSAQAGGVQDMASHGGADLSACAFRAFPGFPGTNPVFYAYDCSCGCMIDSFENDSTNSNWGISTSTGASFVPMAGTGLGMALMSSTASSQLAQAGLVSEGPIAQFFIDGDFDLQVDYDFGAAPPPGEAHLVLGVRKPKTVQGLPVYQVERAREADGSEVYATQLGGVPAVTLPTSASHGTLRLTRQGFTLTSYADGQKVSMLIAQDTNRLVVTLSGTLLGCSAPDAGTSCGYQPRWHNLQLNQGTLVNQPQ